MRRKDADAPAGRWYPRVSEPGPALVPTLALVLTLALAPAGGYAQSVMPGVRVPPGAEVVTGGRFTFVSLPGDVGLARNLLAYAIANDTFAGLPRPRDSVTVLVAPDESRFRDWAGAEFPEWGVAAAFPGEHRIVMQGRAATSAAGDPRSTLRHELGHLSLHEFLGSLPPLWFDEGYASFVAREWSRDQVLESSLILAVRGVPRLAALDTMIAGGAARAEWGYALAHRAVADLAALDPQRGLAPLFRRWEETRSLDAAMRQTYGMTLAGFEEEWRRATRRRYGALALFTDVGFVSLVFFLVVGPFWIVRRRRNRLRLAALQAADDAAARDDAGGALDAMLGAGEQFGGDDDQIKSG